MHGLKAYLVLVRASAGTCQGLAEKLGDKEETEGSGTKSNRASRTQAMLRQ